MSELVTLTRRGDIAVVTIDNPPVNALSPGVPEGVRDAVLRAAGDPGVAVIVVIGAGSTFPAGVDIREFGKAGKLPFDLAGMIREIEDSTKPVVMALHGTAFGGGLEMAMGGHYRVIAPGAQVGQPEVKLGLIPGAAGTQRLPRLAGVEKALEMCVTGEPIGAREALACGIVDRIIEGDLLEGAVAFAREVAGRAVRKTRERTEKLVGVPAEVFDRFPSRGFAVLAAKAAVMASPNVTFEEGCEIERVWFERCLKSPESKALIYVFFGERMVGKIPNRTTPVEVRRVAVAGSGELARALAEAGVAVVSEADEPDIIIGADIGVHLAGGVLEVHPGPSTNPAIIAAAMALGKRLKKIAVLGAIGERVFQAYLQEARKLAAEGVPAEEVNDALVGFGMAAGPLEAGVADGAFFREHSRRDIVHRCVLRMVNEGARLLEAGVALRAVDIDIVCVDGYGFPRQRGGPMFYADTMDLAEVLARMEHFGWDPAPLIKTLAAERKSFAT